MKLLAEYKYFLLIGLISLLTVLIWFKDGYQLGTAEGGLPFNNLDRHAEIFGWAWGDGAMGNSTSFLVASYPTYLFLSQFEKIGIPGYLIEAVVFWFVLTLSGWGIFLVNRRLVGISQEFAVFGVFIYWLSPFVLVNVWNRFLYNHIFFLPLLPLSFFVFWLGLEKKRYSYALLTVLITLLFSYALTALALTTLLLAVFVIVCFYWLVIDRFRNWYFILSYLLLFGIIFGFIHAWWLSQLLFIGSSANFSESVNSFFSTEGNIGGLTEISRKLGSFIDLTRGIHFNFFYDKSSFWSESFITSPALILNSLILLIFFLGIVFSKKNKIMLFFSIFYLFSFFLSKGNSPPFGEIYTYFFVKMPFLQIFRNPFEKNGLITVFSAAILGAYSLERIHQKYFIKYTRLFNGRNYLSIFCILLIGLFWGWPFFSGIVLSVYKNNTGEVAWYQSEVPDYYKSANQAITQNQNVSRFLALPLKDEGISYKWPVGYSGIDIYSTLFHKQNIALNTTIPFYNQIINQVVSKQLDSELVYFLPYLAVDHILLRRDIDYKVRSYPDPHHVEEILNNLIDQKYINKEADYGELTLYSVSDSLNWGKFYTTNQVVFSNGFDFTKSDQLLKTKKVFINPFFFDNLNVKPVETLIFPEKINQYGWLKSFQTNSEQELYSKLLYVRHSPDDIIYPLVRSKEILTSLMYTDYPKWVLFNTDLLGKRAVEICQYDKKSETTFLQDQLVNNYKSEFEALKEHIQRISVENRDLKNKIFNSIITQALLLDRCEKIKLDYFSDFFVQIGIISPLSNKLTYDDLIDVLYLIPWTGSYLEKRIDQKQSVIEPVELTQGEYKIQYLENEIYSKEFINEYSDITVSGEWLSPDLIEVEDYNSQYEITIDYQVQSGDFIKFFVKQNNDSESHPALLTKMPINSNRFQISFTPSVGSKYFKLGISGNEKDLCLNNCLSKDNDLKIYITNIQISKKVLNFPYFTQTNNKSFQNSKIKWEKISPVEYQLSVNKTNSDPEILVFSELYAQGWQLESKNFRHILVNGYANGWILDKAESFTTKVYYQPQYKLDIGYKISYIALFATIILWRGLKNYENN